jgi:hypothetical protein
MVFFATSIVSSPSQSTLQPPQALLLFGSFLLTARLAARFFDFAGAFAAGLSAAFRLLTACFPPDFFFFVDLMPAAFLALDFPSA